MTAATSTPVTGAHCTPVTGPVEVCEPPGEGRTATRFTVSEQEPVLPGHYPGFPIFPGVCLVEYAHLSAGATAPGGAELELAAIESTRFTGPVYPGDRLTAELVWKTREDGWQCRARISSGRGDAAQVRLRYRAATDRGTAEDTT